MSAAVETVHVLMIGAAQRRLVLLSGLGLLLCGLFVLSLVMGPSPVSLPEIAHGLGALMFLDSSELDRGAAIVYAIRAPRTFLGLAVGASLGLAGAALQGLFRNPLVDPSLIGVSMGGALGAASAILFGPFLLGTAVGVLGASLVTASAFGGSLLAMTLVYAIARRSGTLSVATMLLAGIAVNALAGAGLGALLFASNDAALRAITFWTLGSLGGATWTGILPALLVMSAATALLLRTARSLDLFALGEREARHLGCDTARLKSRLVVAAALATGAAVAVSGIINFIGLVAPHILRLLGGGEHRLVLPGSALLGAVLVLSADLLARMLVSPAELPIGVVTSLLGAPVFLWLLLRERTGAT